MFLRCKAQSAAKVSFKQTIRPFGVSFLWETRAPRRGVGGREPNFIHRSDISLNTEKANEMLNIIKDNPELSELTVLLKRDCLKGKYVIHFGI